MREPDNEDGPGQAYEPCLYNWTVAVVDGALQIKGLQVWNDATVVRDDVVDITCNGLKFRPKARTTTGALIVLW